VPGIGFITGGWCCGDGVVGVGLWRAGVGLGGGGAGIAAFGSNPTSRVMDSAASSTASYPITPLVALRQWALGVQRLECMLVCCNPRLLVITLVGRGTTHGKALPASRYSPYCFYLVVPPVGSATLVVANVVTYNLHSHPLLQVVDMPVYIVASCPGWFALGGGRREGRGGRGGQHL